MFSRLSQKRFIFRLSILVKFTQILMLFQLIPVPCSGVIMMSKLLKILGITSHSNIHKEFMQSFILYSQNEQFGEN